MASLLGLETTCLFHVGSHYRVRHELSAGDLPLRYELQWFDCRDLSENICWRLEVDAAASERQ